jgi:hypothetical protein
LQNRKNCENASGLSWISIKINDLRKIRRVKFSCRQASASRIRLIVKRLGKAFNTGFLSRCGKSKSGGVYVCYPTESSVWSMLELFNKRLEQLEKRKLGGSKKVYRTSRGK